MVKKTIIKLIRICKKYRKIHRIVNKIHFKQ